jgi:hypothetical protein
MKSSHEGNNKQRIAIAKGAICTLKKKRSNHAMGRATNRE